MPTSSYKQTKLFLVSLILCLISSLNGEINPISIKYNKSDLKKTLKELVDTIHPTENPDARALYLQQLIQWRVEIEKKQHIELRPKRI